jgi:integrase
MGRPRKCWSKPIGAHGHTVVICERKPNGPLSLRWWMAGGNGGSGQWKWKSLKHSDRELAEQAAREVSAQLLAQTIGEQTGALPLAELFARYESDVSAHKRGTGAAEDARRIALWQHFLGGALDVRALDHPTIDRFVRERRAGRIQPWAEERTGDAKLARKRRLAATPSARAVGADIVFLLAALNWATKVRRANGSPLLVSNPLRGYVVPQNKNPRRPLATYDRWLRVREHADAGDPQRLFGSFMDLVEGLGWRVSAICGLLASDINRAATPNAPHGSILKRAALDKEQVQMWVPMSHPVRAAVDHLRELHLAAARPVIGDVPLFPSAKATCGAMARPWSRWHARDLLERAEQKAGLEPLEGSDFHAYRRAWASARKEMSAVDVAATGGWRDLRSLERCYTLPDEATMLRVMTTATKVREAVASP